jgi:YidC/Oxa1 family membrane protein insertase
MNDQRNLLLAIVRSIASIGGFQIFFPPPAVQEPAPQQQSAQQAGQPATRQSVARPGDQVRSSDAPPVAAPGTDLPVTRTTDTPAMARERLLSQSKRVRIETPRLAGSIALVGGAIDDLTLTEYRVAVSQDSANVRLLSPGTAKGGYRADAGWFPANGAKLALPDDNTVWRANAKFLTPERPVTLSWDNGQGLRFSRRYEVDDNYMFTITLRVENSGAARVDLQPHWLVARYGEPETSEFLISHEGPVGVFREISDEVKADMEEPSYEDVRDATRDPQQGVSSIKRKSVGGWIGFGDHYWLVAILPDQKSDVTMRFFYTEQGDRYQTDYWGGPQSIAPGGAAEVVGHLFAGAKELRVIEDYEARLSVDKFNLAIDFGWFYFLAKPIFKLLHIFNDRIGNFGVSILLLTLLIKIIFFPLANKSYRSMGKMKKLQAEMLKILERHKEDKQRVNQEMMALYKKEKVNPASGCLPMIVQIPVFIALYQLLFATIEMRHAPFFWWIQDLSSPDPTNFVNLFGLLPFSPEGFVPDFLLIGIWPLVMGISMFLQQKLNPTPPDPVQAKVFMFLPLIFTFMLARFPSGLVIYWTWNNILSIAQQWVIMKRAGAFGPQTKKKAKT